MVILQKKQHDPTFQELKDTKDFIMVIPTARTVTAQIDWNRYWY